MIKILEAKRPDYFLLENVPGLKFMDQEYRTIIQSLLKCGYNLHEYILSPHQFDIPQHRPRLFIWGSKKPIDKYLDPKKPISEKISKFNLNLF